MSVTGRRTADRRGAELGQCGKVLGASHDALRGGPDLQRYTARRRCAGRVFMSGQSGLDFSARVCFGAETVSMQKDASWAA